MANSVIQRIVPHLLPVGILFLVSVIYFLPQLQGKKVPSGDIVSFTAMQQEINEYKKTSGKTTWWTNAMFGGMPAYQINGGQPNNMLKYVDKVMGFFFSRPIGLFLPMMLAFYIAMIAMGIEKWLAMIGAIAFGFGTNNMVLFEAGHMAKIKAIGYFPLIGAGAILAYRKRYWLGGGLFLLGMGMSVFGNHPQMLYYYAMTFLFLIVAAVAQAVKKGELAAFGKTTVILGVAVLIALGASASKLWTTYQYSKDTMRGDPILTKTDNQPASSSETKGLDWQYATNWSNGTIDLFSMFIPRVAGGSSGEEVGSDSEIYQDLRRKGANLGKTMRAPLYWGGVEPSTSGPPYFGAVVFLMFILSLVLLKGPIRWWLGLGVLLTLVMSLGRNAEFFNRILFDYFPMYNKFRTPNSILTVTSVLITMGACIGLHEVLFGDHNKEELKKKVLITSGVLGLICLFFAFLGPSFFDMSNINDPRYVQNGFDLAKIKADRAAYLRSDSLRSLLLIALAAGGIYAYLIGKLKQGIILGVLGVLIVFDLWLVDKRYLNNESFINDRQYESSFVAKPADEQIMKDTDPHYRVFDLRTDPFNSSMASYFHKTIGGYHPAKLQRYEDLINRHIRKNNQAVLNMLNTKYFIGQEGQVQRNPNALGNAWFVEDIKIVDNANAEIDALNGLDPNNTAIVHKEFSDELSGFDPQKNGTIALKTYKPDEIVYTSNSSSEQLAVFSEVWYGPNKGWEVTIDGKEVDHIRANYVLRALRVPAGQHEIIFSFNPRAYYIGENISLICSLLTILLFLGIMYKKIVIDKPEDMSPVGAEADQSKGSKIKPTVSKKSVSKKRKKK